MTKPTVGRKIWFWHSAPTSESGEQPEDATIVYVHDDRRVNLRVTDMMGNSRGEQNVTLVQEGDPKPDGNYCEWMPYQKGQAAKTEQLEKAAQVDAGGSQGTG